MKALADDLRLLKPSADANEVLKVVKQHCGPTNLKCLKTRTLPMLWDDNGQVCQTPEELLSRWIGFFGDMQGGQRMTREQQRTHWRHNLRVFRQDSFSLNVADVPTLTDLEIAFRRVPPRKASGLDQIPSELCHACPTLLARHMYGAL